MRPALRLSAVSGTSRRHIWGVSPEPVACGSWDGTTLTPPDPTINHAVASLVMGTLTLTTMSQGLRLQLDDCDVLADLAAAHCDVS